MQHPRIAAFPVMSDKNALPVRTIEGQKTMLNRTVHSIGYDEAHDEIVVNSNIGLAILTYSRCTSGRRRGMRSRCACCLELAAPARYVSNRRAA